MKREYKIEAEGNKQQQLSGEERADSVTRNR